MWGQTLLSIAVVGRFQTCKIYTCFFPRTQELEWNAKYWLRKMDRHTLRTNKQGTSGNNPSQNIFQCRNWNKSPFTQKSILGFSPSSMLFLFLFCFSSLISGGKLKLWESEIFVNDLVDLDQLFAYPWLLYVRH